MPVSGKYHWEVFILSDEDVCKNFSIILGCFAKQTQESAELVIMMVRYNCNVDAIFIYRKQNGQRSGRAFRFENTDFGDFFPFFSLLFVHILAIYIHDTVVVEQFFIREEFTCTLYTYYIYTYIGSAQRLNSFFNLLFFLNLNLGDLSNKIT